MNVIRFSRRQKIVIGALFLVVLIVLAKLYASVQTLQGPSGQVEDASLTYADGSFVLDGDKIRIYSGALHYFRVMPDYWLDRLEKMRAAGLNTVETYIPWNLHEEVEGTFNFEGMLDIRSFISQAQDLGLYVILRPGPFICAEWEFGGLPGWLLHDPNMRVRSNYIPYLEAVDHYFRVLFKELIDLQYSQGGPVIAFQIENEYGSYDEDKRYLMWLKQRMEQYGVVEMLFTSDNSVENMKKGSVPGALITANFKHSDKGEKLFSYLEEVQPGAPLFVMEFWTGWFDHWGEDTHHTWDDEEFEETLTWLLNQGASINFYMMHGGTNFGFMNGANSPFAPTVTSYDYDAPINEYGGLTKKYYIIQRLLHEKAAQKTYLPPLPVPTHAYGSVVMKHMLPFSTLVSLLPEPQSFPKPVAMEMLAGHHSYGFTLYRTVISESGMLEIDGFIKDMAWIIVGGEKVVEIGDKKKIHITDVTRETKLDILIENQGRINYVDFQSLILNQQRKGLQAKVTLAGKELNIWEIYPLGCQKQLISRLSSQRDQWLPAEIVNLPTMYRGTLAVNAAQSKDTFISLTGFTKGVVFINSFNLGRYWSVGPQLTLFVPAPLLKTGNNEVIVFELIQPGKQVHFVDKPVLSPHSL